MKTYRHKGKLGNLQHIYESKDMFIIRTFDSFDPKMLLNDHANRMGHIGVERVDHFPEASVYLFTLKKNIQNDSLSNFKKAISNLKDERIRFIGTVYQNKQGNYQIYTGNLFLKFKDDISENVQHELIDQFGLKKKLALTFNNGSYFLEPLEELGRDIFEKAEELLSHDSVELCHPEIVVKRKSISFGAPIEEPAVNNDWLAKMIRLPQAWQHTKGKDVKICIIDDGIDLSHKAFAPSKRNVKTVDMLGDINSNASHKYDSEMHGTACASIACSCDPLALGVAPEADLLVVRTKGLGSVLEAEAIRWAADQGADIISCSWGPSDGVIGDPSDDEIYHNIPDHTRLALNYAASKGRDGKGCLIFFAAGNGMEQVITDGYASNPDVLAIGSVNKEGQPSMYSDNGYPLFCCFPSSDIMLHGDKVIQTYGLLTADRTGEPGYSATDYFTAFGGTSASCPGMAGVAALMLSIMDDLTIQEARKLLEESCTIPYNKDVIRDKIYGYGIIDAATLVDKTLALKQKRNPVMSTSNNNTKLRALHIALNYVDDTVYESKLALNGCENDAAFYNSLCEEFKEHSTVIKNEEATRENVIKHISHLAQISKGGDYVFMTYAGHGSQVNDTSGDEIDDQADETLVLYDGLLIDDELNNLFATFDPGVNVIWISDSCHSGTNTKAVKKTAASEEDTQDANNKPRYVAPYIAQDVFNTREADYLSALNKLPQRSTRDEEVIIKANLLTIAAVQDHQYAGDLPDNGEFTGALKRLRNQHGDLSYSDLIDLAKAILPKKKQPKVTLRGPEHQLNQEVFFKPGTRTNTIIVDPSPESKNDNPENDKGGEDSDESLSKAMYYGDDIIVIGDKLKDNIKLNTTSDSIRGVSDNSLVISMESVAGNRLPHSHPWDKAYALVMNASDEDALESAEPDIISAINPDPNSSTRAGRYLKSYPHPRPEDLDTEPLIWHLDDDHSQLRSAFKEATKKEEKKGGCTEETKQDFPLIVHIDTGLLQDRPTGPLNYQKDLSEDFADPVDKDRIWGKLVAETQGHGQATATILAGDKLTSSQSKSNYKGYLGAFPYARVVSLRISETVVLLSGRRFAKAVEYAIKIKADVITMSMAGAPSQRMMRAINRAYEAGILIVSAAGNSWSKGGSKLLPDTVMYPARFDRVLGVTGATYYDTPYLVEANEGWDTWKDRAEGSEIMQTCYGPSHVMGHVIAAYTPNITWASKPKNKGIFSMSGGGTSSATPQVAAAAALWLHHHKAALVGCLGWQRVEAVRQALYQSAKNVHPEVFGNGILRARQALDVKPTRAYINKLKQTPPDELKKGWLGGIIGMWNGRNIKNRNNRLEEMVAMEIEQLIMSDPNLKRYQTYGEESSQLKLALLKSPYASNYLKQLISIDQDILEITSDPVRSRSINVPTYGAIFDLQEEDKPDQRIIVTSDQSSVQAQYDSDNSASNLIGTMTIDISDQRSRAGDSFQVRIPEDDDLAYLVIKTDERGRHSYAWQHPHMPTKAQNDRSIRIDGDKYILTLDTSVNRGLITGIKRIVIKVFRIIVDKAASSMQGLICYDSKVKAEDNPWRKVDKTIAKAISTQPKILLLSHGTFSSTEDSFGDLLSANVLKSLGTKKYGRYILGFNMPTVKSSIKKNASALVKSLKTYGIPNEKLRVLGYSRGCLVAREALSVETPMVLAAGPQLGTPLAHKDFILTLIDTITSITMAVSGPASPVISAIPKVIGWWIKKEPLLGITDMMKDSSFLTQLNKAKPLTAKQVVLGTNFNGLGWKGILDHSIDTIVFKDEPNDMVIPLNSSLSTGKGDCKRIVAYGDSKSHHLGYFRDEDIVESILSEL